MTVEKRQAEIGRGTAHGYALALAEVSADRNAGDPLQGLGDILVRKLADIFGGDGIDDRIGSTLDLDRLLKAGADTRDDDLFVFAVSRRRFRRVRRRRVRRSLIRICRLCLCSASEER